MLRAEIRKVSPDTESILPNLEFHIKFSMAETSVIQGISGVMRVDGKSVGNVFEKYRNHGDNRIIKIPYPSQKPYDEYATLRIDLDDRAIQFFENSREKNNERSLIFTLELEFRLLSLPANTDKMLTPSEAFMVMNYKSESLWYQVSQSDWINKFAQQLGIGEFLLVELNIPSPQKTPAKWSELYDRLNLRLWDIKSAITAGDWYKAITKARLFYENLKFGNRHKSDKEFKTELKQMFIDERHSEASFEEFRKLIESFFNFLSKFMHDKDNLNGELNTIPNPSKEDAYMAYTVALAVMNVISSKLSKSMNES